MTHRTRTRGGLSYITPSLLVFNKSGDTKREASGGLPARIGTFETMTDVVSRGFQPGKTWYNNPMERVSTTYTSQFANGSQNRIALSWQPDDDAVATGSRSLIRELEWDGMLKASRHNDISSLISLACTQALARVAAPEVAGLVALAELKSTVHALRHPLEGVLRFLERNAPRRRRRQTLDNLRGSAGDLADQHLLIIFGIMPFLSDIQGILKAITGFDGRMNHFTARGTASSKVSGSLLFNFIKEDDGNNIVTAVGNDTLYSTVDVRAYQFYSVKVTIADALGLSPKEIPQSMWQLLPWSFVIDWFANVGAFIRALTPKPQVTLGHAGYTIRRTDLCATSYDFKLTKRRDVGWTGAFNGGSATRRVVATRRVPGDIGRYTGLHWKSNRHQDLLDVFKISASISLITQRLSKYRW